MLNGFIKSKYSGVKESRKNLQILFSGTFYLTQPIEDILEIINDKLKEGLLPKQTKIIFLGTAAVPSVADRVRKAIVGYEEYYEITPRIEHSKAMEIQLSSDLLVMPSHIGIKGIPSSKLFDYVSTGLPVLLYPNDGDVIEEILNTTKLGLICNTKNEISHTLDKLVQAKEQGATIVTPELDTINMYSRKEQTKVLERTIDKLLSEE
jgi:glycosyltransferase involved in cell wall biosynthesis